ncbi:MAG: shikimate dehydrogenase [Dehalococcoidia bacterium]
MKREGVIGYPLSHSLSPTIFQAAFDAAGFEARYEKWPTPPEDIEPRMASLREDDVFGGNVTIPHKEAVIPHLDRLDPLAERIGAVNTIVNEGGRLAGYNTDVPGFARSLREDAAFDARGCRAVVLGAGGAARAIVVALIEHGAARIDVVGRTTARVEKLVSDLDAQAGSTALAAGDEASLREADLIVNCTPLGTRGSAGEGQSPIEARQIPRDAVVFDLVYNPPDTPLVLAARDAGARGASGLGMLVYQAAESFRLWTGDDAPAAVMFEAGRAALGVGVAR